MRLFAVSLALFTTALCQSAAASEYVTRAAKVDARNSVYVLAGGRVEIKLHGADWRESNEGTLDQMAALTIESERSSEFLSKPFLADSVLTVTRKSTGETLRFRVTVVPVPK